MSENGKAAIAILIVLLLLSLSAAGGAYYLFQQEHKRNLILQDDLDELKTRQKITESRLEESKNMLAALDARLKDTRGEITGLADLLDAEKKSRQDALAQIDMLRADLDEQKKLRMQLEDDLAYAQDALDDTEAELDSLITEKMRLESRVNDLQSRSTNLEDKMEGVELGKIVVNSDKSTPKKKEGGWWPWGKKEKDAPEPEKSPAPQPKPEVDSGQLQGEILIVNRDYNFVVMNLGTKDGVSVGDLFSLYHDNKYIGDVKVSKLHDSMAAADFISDDAKDVAAEGDKVILNS